MNYKLKQVLAMVCSLVMLLSIVVPISAAGTPTVTVESKTVNSGTGTADVAITLTLKNNPGLLGCRLAVTYDSGLTLTGIEKGSALSTMTLTPPGNLSANPVNLLWDALEIDSTNGVLVTLSFTVPVSATKTFPITLSYQNGDIFDETQSVNVTLVPGEIKVICTSHTWDAGKVTTDPTCTAAGVKTYTCTVCGDTKTEAIKALGHSFTNYVSDGNATCAKDGTKTALCDHDCGEKKTVTDTGSKNSVEHTPDGNTDCSKATKCTVCGKVLKAAGSHTWDAGKVTTDPTCTAAGVKTYTCTVCGATKTEAVKALGHSFTNYVSDGNATCAKDGTKTALCDHDCGEKKTVTDTGSKNSVEHTPDGNTDCTKATKCTVCGKVLKAAGTHIWDEDHPNVTKKATCTETGTAVYTCTVDGATEEREIPALGHDLVYTAEGAVLTETCSRCDHTATATVTAEAVTYTGTEIKTGKAETSEGWLGGDLTVEYTDNIGVGTAKATITKGEATATAEFAIEKAAEYTLTLDKLTQTVGSVTGVAYKLTPADETASVSIEYCIVTPASPCTHVHDETCNYNEETKTCDHVHDDACGYAEEASDWVTEVPTEVGTYAVRAKLVSSDNIAVPETADYVTGELKIQRRTSGGGGGSSSAAATDSGKTDNTDSEKTDNTDNADKDNQDSKDPTPTTPKFTDVAENSWYKEATDYVTEKGLMGGTGSGTFAPEGTMTRAMVMTVLARHAGEDTEGGATWYEKGMKWAKDNGVSDGTNPDGDVTREQLAVMLYRYAGEPAAEGELTFSDASDVSTWAEAAMKWAVAKGIIGGMGKGVLNPQGNATRAQVATILMRFMELNK